VHHQKIFRSVICGSNDAGNKHAAAASFTLASSAAAAALKRQLVTSFCFERGLGLNMRRLTNLSAITDSSFSFVHRVADTPNEGRMRPEAEGAACGLEGGWLRALAEGGWLRARGGLAEGSRGAG
jgi:hypothetical protein